jgi:hypothetical protein
VSSERKSLHVVHRDRHPQIDKASSLDTRERFLRDANDLEALLPERECAANDGRVATEPTLPE